MLTMSGIRTRLRPALRDPVLGKRGDVVTLPPGGEGGQGGGPGPLPPLFNPESDADLHHARSRGTSTGAASNFYSKIILQLWSPAPLRDPRSDLRSYGFVHQYGPNNPNVEVPSCGAGHA